MNKIAYIFILVFLSIFFQVLIGSAGLMFPATALIIFYLTIITDWQTGTITGAAAGSIVDILCVKTMILSPALLIITALIAILWLNKGDLKNLSLQIIPAAFISALCIFSDCFVACQTHEHGFYLLLIKLLLAILSLFLSCIIFPPFIMLMDKINATLNLNLYTKAQERIEKG